MFCCRISMLMIFTFIMHVYHRMLAGFHRKFLECVNYVIGRMRSSRLLLNPDKTEFMWRAADRRRHQLFTIALVIGSTSTRPVSFVHDLGIFIDSDLMMSTLGMLGDGAWLCRSSPGSIRRLVSLAIFKSVIVALILCRLYRLSIRSVVRDHLNVHG